MSRALPLLAFIALATTVAGYPSDTVPLQELQLQTSGATVTPLRNDSRSLGSQSSGSLELDYYQRHPVAHSSVYWGAGAYGELYGFHNTQNFPINRLQGYAAQIGLEYFMRNEMAAFIRLKPGAYFQNHITSEAWDAPVECATGVPFYEGWNGVLGIENGRFYHHPVPIVGVRWQVSSVHELNVTYPEPSWVAVLRDKLESKLGGELHGDGFKTDDTRVEYYSYRLGETLTYRFLPEWSLVGGAGYELKRVFDFYRDQTKLEGGNGAFLQFGIAYAR